MNRRDMMTFAAAGSLAAVAPGRAAAARGPDHGSNRSQQVAEPNWVKARDGTRLYVRSWGEGSPLIFLAGWSLPSEMWSYQMAGLADRGFRCIAFDRRGHGRSDDPGHGYDYETLSDDLGRVLESLDVKRATVVAHSMAGGEVVRYLRRSGAASRIERAVFLATTLPCLTQRPDNALGAPPAFFDQLRSRFYNDFPKWLDENAEPFVVPSTSPLMRSWIKNIMLATSLNAVIELNKAMTSADFRSELAALRLPALFIHGDKDASSPLPISAVPASKLVQGSQLIVYEGAPHGLFVTHIDKLNKDIERFARSSA